MAALNHTKKTVSNSKTFTLTTMINTANVSFCTITTTTLVSFSSLPGSAKFSPSTWTEIFVNNYNVYTEGTGTGKQTNAAKLLPSGVTSPLVDKESGLCQDRSIISQKAPREHIPPQGLKAAPAFQRNINILKKILPSNEITPTTLLLTLIYDL